MSDQPIMSTQGMAAIWAARLADGSLTSEDEKALQAWLDANSANGQALEEAAVTWETVERYAAHPKMMAARAAALAEVRRSHRGGTFEARRPMITMVAAAAILVMVLAGAAWLKFAPHTYQTGLGERRVVSLKDGSRLTLDAATTVRVAYSGNARRLWLDKGRAKFDVAKDLLRPFSVEAGGKVVVATGTAFSVERVQRQVQVVLFEGKIAILDDGEQSRRTPNIIGVHRRSEVFLTAGQEMIVGESGLAKGPPKILAANLASSKSWETGELTFDDEPLGSVLERVNRYAEQPFRVDDAALNNIRISGIFKAGDTTAFSQGLQFAFGLKLRAEGGEIVLSKN